MGKQTYPVSEIKESLRNIEAEVAKLENLTRDIPGIQKNIVALASFIDILKFHIGDLKAKDDLIEK